MPDSEFQIIKLHNNGSHYQFFRFVMEALDVIFFSHEDNRPLVEPKVVPDFDWLTHEQLVYKFTHSRLQKITLLSRCKSI